MIQHATTVSESAPIIPELTMEMLQPIIINSYQQKLLAWCDCADVVCHEPPIGEIHVEHSERSVLI